MFKIKNKLAVMIILLSVGFLFLIGYSLKRDKVSVLENGTGVVINVFQGALYKVTGTVSNSIEFVVHYADVKKENDQLKKRNQELEKMVSDYDFINGDNVQLRAMFNFKNERAEFNYIGCDIVAKSGVNYLEGYTVNRGYKDGIRNGMVVIVAEGLVGQVTSVADSYAKIQCLSNENIGVSITIQSTNENLGVIKGYRDSSNTQLAKIYFLPVDSKIKKDDVILTSGTGRVYPRGIRIGNVLSVENDVGKVQKTAMVKPYVDFNSLQQVYVVVPKEMPKDGQEIQY
jgi:rod shape-determining protein MreC